MDHPIRLLFAPLDQLVGLTGYEIIAFSENNLGVVKIEGNAILSDQLASLVEGSMEVA